VARSVESPASLLERNPHLFGRIDVTRLAFDGVSLRQATGRDEALDHGWFTVGTRGPHFARGAKSAEARSSRRAVARRPAGTSDFRDPLSPVPHGTGRGGGRWRGFGAAVRNGSAFRREGFGQGIHHELGAFHLGPRERELAVALASNRSVLDGERHTRGIAPVSRGSLGPLRLPALTLAALLDPDVGDERQQDRERADSDGAALSRQRKARSALLPQLPDCVFAAARRIVDIHTSRHAEIVSASPPPAQRSRAPGSAWVPVEAVIV
jgi:hypothetical protein